MLCSNNYCQRIITRFFTSLTIITHKYVPTGIIETPALIVVIKTVLYSNGLVKTRR